MRRSCLTSNFVIVVLGTSMYFSGIGNDSSLGEKSWTPSSTWWRYMKFPDMDQKSFIASPASGNESWGGGRHPSDSPRKSLWLSPRIGCSRIKVGVLSSWYLLQKFWFVHLRLENEFYIFFGKYCFLRIESFRIDFRCVHRLKLLKVCDEYVTLPNSRRVQSASKKQSR